jgi:hypothetical protein
MAYFQLTWVSGEKEVLVGDSISEAFNSCYSAGAFSALDSYKEVQPPTEGWVLSKSFKVGSSVKENYTHPNFPGFSWVRLLKSNGIRTKGFILQD